MPITTPEPADFTVNLIDSSPLKKMFSALVILNEAVLLPAGIVNVITLLAAAGIVVKSVPYTTSDGCNSIVNVEAVSTFLASFNFTSSSFLSEPNPCSLASN
ncbi:hypothetical protein D3C78_1793930 [compost metagenome]